MGKAKAKPKRKATKKAAPTRGRKPVHRCVVAGAQLRDTQVGNFSMATIKKMTGRELYTAIADRVQAKIKDGERTPARNIAYKAKLRIVATLKAKGITLAG